MHRLQVVSALLANSNHSVCYIVRMRYACSIAKITKTLLPMKHAYLRSRFVDLRFDLPQLTTKLITHVWNLPGCIVRRRSCSRGERSRWVHLVAHRSRRPGRRSVIGPYRMWKTSGNKQRRSRTVQIQNECSAWHDFAAKPQNLGNELCVDVVHFSKKS